MKTATVRQVRHDFGSVLRWIEEGEEVEITKRGKVIARLTPPPAPTHRPKVKPVDYAARQKRIFGDKMLPGNSVLEERESCKW